MSSPATSRSNVDLPHPDGPSSATNSPGSTLKADIVQHRQLSAVDVERMADIANIHCRTDRRIACDGFCNGLRYHLTTPFCHDKQTVTDLNRSVIAPEHSNDITMSAAYMLA